MGLEPPAHRGMLVRRVVIVVKVQVEFRIGRLVNQLQELDPLLMALPGLAFADHDVERCEGRRRAVAAGVFRQTRLGAVERSDLTFFVDRPYQRPLGRIDLLAGEVEGILDERWIVGNVARLHEMRLEAVNPLCSFE